MAVVYLARDEELDRPVAIKVLAEHLASDASFRRRFLREARLAARLSHPNVVNVYDAGEDGAPYIVMEHVEGETLADMLRHRGRLPPDEAIGFALQACAGLAHAHRAGLVHRDVKPHNLLVRADGTLKIVDFGIARAAELTQLTQAGTVLGTGAYLAPEQAAGEEVAATADVYSLGVVLYELVAGRTPYQYESVPELLRQQSTEPVPPLSDHVSDVPAPLEDVVMRCLARNPAHRPGSAEELASELARALPEAVTEPLPAQAEPLTGRRSWTRIWVAAVVVLAVLALLTGAIALSGDDPSPSPQQPAVAPIPRGRTPAEQARNLAAWLRENSR